MEKIVSYNINSHYGFGGRDELVDKINKAFSGFEIRLEDSLKMNTHSLKNYLKGIESISARYAPGKIRIPKTQFIKLIYIPNNKEGKQLIDIYIPKIVVKSFKDVTIKEAYADGRQTPDELFKEMKEIYEPIYDIKLSKNDIISLWHLRHL